MMFTTAMNDRKLSGVLLGFLTLLNLAAQDGFAQQKVSEVTPFNTAYIAADFHGVVVVHVGRLIESRLGKGISAQDLQELEKVLGFPLKSLEQVVVVFDHVKPDSTGAKKLAPKDDWVLLQERDAGFEIRFPKAPIKSERKGPARQIWTLTTGDSGLDFEISVGTFGDDFKGTSPEFRLDTAARGLEFKPGFQSKKEIRQNTMVGAEIVIDDKQLGTSSVHRVFVVGQRNFVLSAIARGKQPPADFAKFLDSFALTTTLPTPSAELFPPGLAPVPGFIFRFQDPINGAKVIGKMLKDAKVANLQGKKVYRSQKETILGMPLAAFAVDTRTILVAPEPVLVKMLSAQPAGPLVQRLKALNSSCDLAAVLWLQPYQDFINGMTKALAQAVPPPWNDALAVAGNVNAITFVADFAGKTILSMAIESRDEATSKTLERTAKEAVEMARKMGPKWRDMLNQSGLPPGVRKELLVLNERALSDLEWKSVGNRLEISVPRAQRPSVASLSPDYKPLVPRTAKEEIDLGGEVTDACVGGGGRYLCYLLREKRRVAIFDVQQGMVVKEIEVDGSALIAAGARQLAIVSRSEKLLTLWNLTKLTRERNVLLPDPLGEEEISYLCMGSNSLGPIYAYHPSKRTLALDLPKLTVRHISWTHFGPTNAYGPLALRASADGQVILGHGGGWAGLEMIRFELGKQVERSMKFGFSGGVFANISEDGQTFYIPGEAMDRDSKPTTMPGYLVPARESGFFLSLLGGNLPQYFLGQANLPGSHQAAIYSENRTKLLVLNDLSELKTGSKVPWEKIVHYYPRAGLLVTLAEKSKVVLRPLDLVQRMDKANLDYLVVFPQPALGKLGTTFTQKLDVRGNRGGFQYQLTKGPEGLAISAQGQITWPIPRSFPDSETTAIISIRDSSGQEVTHRLRIVIDDE